MCSLEGKKYFRNFFTNEPEKKVHLRQKKSIFPFFLLPLISGIKLKVLEAETPKVENFYLNSQIPGIRGKIFTKKIYFFLRKHPNIPRASERRSIHR